MLFMSCACQAFASVHCCLVVPGLQKADIFIGSRLCCLIAFFVTFFMWYPRSGVVLDCIDFDLCSPFYFFLIYQFFIFPYNIWL